jgi:four helix bundle protein
MPFLFEKLEVYKRSIRFVVEILGVCREIRHKNIKDQLERACLSIPLNIAEGNGRNTAKEKIQFFKTARGSLFECVPLLQICHLIGLCDQQTYEIQYNEAEEIGKMLNGLINSFKGEYGN